MNLILRANLKFVNLNAIAKINITSLTGTVRVWHSSTYRLETALNYGLERVWALAHLRGSNDIAIGYDEGSVIVKVRLPALRIGVL